MKLASCNELLAAPPRRAQTTAFVVCAAIFAALAAWVLAFPYSGEGDAVFHYLIARIAPNRPIEAISAFARPLHKLLLVVPAQGGMAWSRIFSALLTTILAWQTIRLAEDCGIRNSILAPLMLILQPFVFALAADTMTELPMALAIVVAMRLWQHHRPAASCLLVSFLPMLRPEGFFLMALWGILAIFTPALGSLRRRAFCLLLLPLGPICWLLLARIISGDSFYMVRNWNWPAWSYTAYGHGAPWHHIVRWPMYCGPVLLVLFLLGLRRSFSRPMLLPWAVWLLVFLLHSILFWGGWFASLGLMRILATTSPITALICLQGWNAAADALEQRGSSLITQRIIGHATLVLAVLCAVSQYWLFPDHHHHVPILRVAAFLRQERLGETAPVLFTSDRVLLAELGYPKIPKSGRIARNNYDRREQLAELASLPAGSIGMWDNQQGVQWYHVDIDDLPPLGYTILYEVTQPAPDLLGHFNLGRPWLMQQRYAVLRKN